MIELYTDHTQLNKKSTDPIPSGIINALKIRVTFDSSYNDLIKFVVFKCGETTLASMGDTLEYNIPWEILVKQNEGKEILVGVYGSNGTDVILTTNYVSIGKLIKGCDIEDTFSEPPSPSVVQFILDAANQAVNTANEALEVANDEQNIAKQWAGVAEENAQTATTKTEESQQSAAQSLSSAQTATVQANRASSEADRASNKADEAEQSETVTTQTMQDLLNMMGEDIATLTGGKLTPSQIPAIAITDTFVVGDEMAMLALICETGDIAIRTDQNKTYILQGTDPSVLSHWQQLKSPTNYADTAGHALTSDNAENANKINNKRLVAMTESQYDVAVKNEDTFYAVVPD